MELFGLIVTTCIIFAVLEWPTTFTFPSSRHNFFITLSPTQLSSPALKSPLVGEEMRTHYFWQYPLVIISCSYMLSHNGIVWFGVVVQWNCLVWCCRTMELFGLVLSDNGIVWFGSYNLYNFCCPRVTHKGAPCGPQLFHYPLSNTTFFSWRGHIIFGNILLS